MPRDRPGGPEVKPGVGYVAARTAGATSVPEQFDRAHDVRVGHGADAHLGEEAAVPEDLVLLEDLLDHLLRAADHEGALRRAHDVELLARHRRPSPLAPDPGHHVRVAGVELTRGPLGCLGHIGVRVDADRECRRVVPGAPRGLAVEVDQRPEPLGRTPDDGDRERQAERARAHDRLRRSADRDPDRQWVLDRPGIDAQPVKRRPVASRPRDDLGLAQSEQQVELLGEQVVVVLQVLAEERERLDERPAPGHDLGPSAREQVEGGEGLEDTHRVVRAQHRDGAREPDALGALTGRSQGDGRRRHREVGPMVFADPEHLQADLVRQLDLLDQVAQPPGCGDGAAARRVGRKLREGVDADLDGGNCFWAGR